MKMYLVKYHVPLTDKRREAVVVANDQLGAGRKVEEINEFKITVLDVSRVTSEVYVIG